MPKPILPGVLSDSPLPLGTRGPVLLVEDEEDVADIVEEMLKEIGYKPIQRAATVGEALRLLDSTEFDIVVLDALLRGTPAHQVASRLRDARIPFVVSTAYDPEKLPVSFRAGVSLRKPYAAHELMRALDSATKRTRDN